MSEHVMQSLVTMIPGNCHVSDFVIALDNRGLIWSGCINPAHRRITWRQLEQKFITPEAE